LPGNKNYLHAIEDKMDQHMLVFDTTACYFLAVLYVHQPIPAFLTICKLAMAVYTV
jgi:hypothetical protein